MLKIGIDARFLQNQRRGQGQYVYYLVKALLASAPQNHYALFYNGFTKGAFAFPGHAALKQVWSTFPGSILKRTWPWFAYPPIERLIGAVDVFHNPVNFSFTHYSPIPSRAPMVATFNGMADPATIWKRYNVRPIDRWFELVGRNARRIIAVSQMVKDDFLQRIRVPEEKIRVIYYGADDYFKPVEDQAALNKFLSAFGLVGNRYILYVGAAERNKNLSTLVRAFASVIGDSRFGDLKLVLTGTIDESYQSIIAYARQMGISDRTICTGYIEHEKLPLIYSGASAFVLPTLYEWFGIPVLEALRCRVPCIVSKNTGALEVVRDSVLTFESMDADELSYCIRRILEDRQLRDSLQEKGVAAARPYTWEKTARETLEVYREAAQ